MRDRGVFTQGSAESHEALAGKKYRPSNGVEGDIFQEHWCYECRHLDEESERFCEILDNTMFFDTKDEQYPSEWQYGEDGRPKCTAYEGRD